MNLKVKDFAAQQGVSESIIYRHIRQHREELGDMVLKEAKATWLTEEGQDFLRQLMVKEPLIVVSDARKQAQIVELQAEVEALRAEKDRLNRVVEETLKTSLRQQEQIVALQGAQARLELAEAKQQVLEESREEFKARAAAAEQEAAAAKAELDDARAELNRLKNRSFWQRVFGKEG